MARNAFLLPIFPGQWCVILHTLATAVGGAVVFVLGFAEEMKPRKDLLQ